MKNSIKDVYMYILGSVVVIGFFMCIYFLIYTEIPSQNEKMLYLAIGALVAKFGDVINYFYGSSKGSSEKTQMLHNNLKKKEGSEKEEEKTS